MLCVERTDPDALVMVLGDFNKGHLSHKVSRYKQFIKCPTDGGRQFVRLGTHVSDSLSPSSPLLFSLYTNSCTSGHQSASTQ
ncbi:hypothetical protein EXN66_Car003585 [Channa argus]|uniref:Uncharacterized protein n=1 Tax=Channa argus TaxID=215402 RepID=A0A6G1PCH9_CHAAH|nr:hypothetical protein EXN66_Car003585 [Channa argus]